MRKLVLLVVIIAGYCIEAKAQPASQERIGYANMEYIISQLPDMKEIQAEMKSAETQFRNQIQARSQKLQQQYKEFNQNMNTMVDTVRENRKRALEQEIADLEKFQQDARVTLENKQKLYMAPLYLKVNRAIADVAKENGFALILTDKLSSYRVLLYEEPQADVSNLVLRKFGVTPSQK